MRLAAADLIEAGITPEALTITALRRLTADEESAVAEEGPPAGLQIPDDAALEIRFTIGT